MRDGNKTRAYKKAGKSSLLAREEAVIKFRFIHYQRFPCPLSFIFSVLTFQSRHKNKQIPCCCASVRQTITVDDIIRNISARVALLATLFVLLHFDVICLLHPLPLYIVHKLVLQIYVNSIKISGQEKSKSTATITTCSEITKQPTFQETIPPIAFS